MRRNSIIMALAIGAGVLLMTRNTWTIPGKAAKYVTLFQAAEYKYGLPRFLLAKQAEQESDYNPAAVSSAGAQGIMQIVPRWHPGVDPFDVPEAIDYAAGLMRRHYARFGSWVKALAAYNAGPTALQNRIDEHGVNWLANMPAETQKYIARITNDVRVT